MIKFFRKIRYDLMEKNKTGKYLKYAIGEIILVVIGILIALSINNWNESRKLETDEKELIADLKEEFNHNINIINDEININTNIINRIAKFIDLFSEGTIEASEDQIATLFKDAIGSEFVYKPATGVINEAINSGKLSLVKNFQLKNQISLWESKLMPLRNQEILVNEEQAICFNYILTHGDFRKMREITEKGKNSWFNILKENKFTNTTNKHLLQSKELENHMIIYMGSIFYLSNSQYKNMRDYMTNVVQLIEKDLSND